MMAVNNCSYQTELEPVEVYESQILKHAYVTA